MRAHAHMTKITRVSHYTYVRLPGECFIMALETKSLDEILEWLKDKKFPESVLESFEGA